MNKSTLAVLMMVCLVFIPAFELDARGRGGGGRRGGGGFSRGGGGRSFNRGGGGRSMSRPSRPTSRPSRPSYNRPSSRPSTPSFSRPSRPSGNRPSVGNRPSTGSRPSIGNRPTTRPGMGNRPNINPGQRPSIRPGTGNRPSTLPSRPGTGNRPGAGNRPGIDRPSQRPTLPGLGNGNRPNIGNRPGIGNGDRTNIGNRVGGGNRIGNNNVINNNRVNINNRRGYSGVRSRSYHYHSGWHHGHWHGGYRYGGYRGRYWWNRYPVLGTIGLTTWAVNRVAWVSGYYRYRNPYYVAPTVVDNSVYNYSQPIIVQSEPEVEEGQPAAEPATEPPADALADFDEARQKFYSGQYNEALTSVDEAIKQMPNDAVLHEFRALVLFAMKNYQDAAATLHAVLSAGPGWDWTTMIGLYPNVETYTRHLRALEQYQDLKPKDPAARLVLAYQYITAGHNDAAKTQLQKLVELTPDDALARDMLAQADPDAEPAGAGDFPKPPEVTANIDPKKFVGTWRASRGNDSRFEMKLGADDKFDWIYTSGKDRQELKGSYTVDDKGVLQLDTGESGVMAAQLVPKGNDQMDFYMLGDTEGSPPLKFTR